MKLSRSRRDHIGIWFEERRKLGISDNILFAFHLDGGEELDRYIYNHGDLDGISCFMHRLDSLGEKYKEVPLSQESSEPNRNKYREIQKNRRPYSKAMHWLYWDEQRKDENNHVYAALFSQKQTTMIKKRAEGEGVSLNILLFWALNKACSELLINNDKAKVYSWLYPVSVRGAVDYGTPYSNYSSGFYLQVDKDVGIQKLKQLIVERLKSGEHWINWKQAKLAKYIPRFLTRILYQYMSKRNFYAGSFSSLGKWRSEALEPMYSPSKKRGSWFACAPGTANYPVSNGCLVWNGRLSVSLKLHHTISPYPEKTREVLCRWSDLLLNSRETDDDSGVKIVSTII